MIAIIAGIVGHYVPKMLSKALSRSIDLSGNWRFVTTTRETSYEPFQGMQLTYLVVLDSEGQRVFGRGEKDHESSSAYVGRQDGKDRSQITLSGWIRPGLMRPTRVAMTFCETAKLRESTARHELILSREKTAMSGKFTTSIASQHGEVHWWRQDP